MTQRKTVKHGEKIYHLYANHLNANVAKCYWIKINFPIKSIISDKPTCCRITKGAIQHENLAIMNLCKMVNNSPTANVCGENSTS